MNRYIPITLALLLSGCTVGPDFMPPLADFEPDWISGPQSQKDAEATKFDTHADPDPDWWKSFNDAELNSLIDRAIAGNLDVQEAVLRIDESRAEETITASAGLPKLSGSASYTRYQLGIRGAARNFGGGFGGGAAGAGTAGENGSGIPSGLFNPFNLYSLGLDASWETDLFGKVRRETEEQEARTTASIEDRNATLVALEGEVGLAYAQLRGAQAQNKIAQENIKVEQDIVDLTKRLNANGLASDLDVDNAATALTNTQAQLPQYAQQTEVSANRLSMLLGKPPGAVDAELATPEPVPAIPPDLPIGMPADLARRRPDIREAEANLHAATADVGVAVARLYPDLTLSGSAGIRSTDFDTLTHWANHFYQAGPTLALPLFQGGEVTATVTLTEATQKVAALDYEKTVLNALEEVENDLAAYRSDKARQISLTQTVNTSADGLKLAQARYQHGLSSFIDVLNSETTLVEARQQLTDAILSTTADVVNLYKALGGGWENNTYTPAPQPDLLERIVTP